MAPPDPITLTDGEATIVLDVELLQKALDDHRKKGQQPSDDLKELDDAELKEVEAIYRRQPAELKAVEPISSTLPKETECTKCCGFRRKEFRVLNKPALPDCYEEIKKLLDIEESPIYAKALEEWSKKETLFTSRVERKKKKVDHLKNEIYQLIGFFSVFQGVLLTAVSQSNLLHCNNLWSPIVLSVSASVVAVAGVTQKLMQIKSFQTTIHSEEQSLKEVARRLNSLKGKGVKKFKFANFVYNKKKEQSTRRFWLYFLGVIGSLLIFAVVFPISHWKISCDPGPNPYPK